MDKLTQSTCQDKTQGKHMRSRLCETAVRFYHSTLAMLGMRIISAYKNVQQDKTKQPPGSRLSDWCLINTLISRDSSCDNVYLLFLQQKM